MRVLHITNAGGFGRLQSGGAERAVCELSGALADLHGWDEYVAAPAEYLDQYPFSSAVTKVPVPLKSIGIPSALNPAGALQATIRRIGPDVVVGHLLRGTIAGATAARLAHNGKFVSILHGSLHDMQRGSTSIRSKTNLAGFRFVGRRLVDLHVAISESNQRDLVELDGIPKTHTVRIHNWVSDEFSPSDQLVGRNSVRHNLAIEDDAFTMAIVGRLEEVKNHEFVLRILPELPAAQLLIVGDGSLDSLLRKTAEELGVSDRVHFVGNQARVAPFMEAADVVLVPSKIEGFGRTVIESLAVGTSVITSDLEPIREILALVPPDSFAIGSANDHDGWLKLLNNSQASPRRTIAERHELSSAVRTRFALTSAAREYDLTFQKLLVH